MRSYLLVIFFIFLFGCAQLMNGQIQPVIEKDAAQKIFFTTCSGTVEDWGSCFNKARKTCSGDFSVIKRFESAVGGRRELTFQCKQ